MPSSPDNPNFGANNSGERDNYNSRVGQHVNQALLGESKIEDLTVDQLLELDINTLSYEDLQKMQTRLQAERATLKNEINSIRQSLNLPPLDDSPAPATESAPSSEAQPAQNTNAAPNSTQAPAPVTPDEILETGDTAATETADDTSTSQPSQPQPLSPDQINRMADNAIADAAAASAPDMPTNDIVNQPAESAGDAPTVDQDTGSNPETITPDEAAAAADKAKRKPSLRRMLMARVAPLALGAAMLFGFAANASAPVNRTASKDTIRNEQQMRREAISRIGQSAEAIIAASTEAATVDNEVVNSEFAGELANGVTYDYSHYADRDGKESYNSFDYNMSEHYGNAESTKESFLSVAKTTPEALAAYSYSIFNESEKSELGISGMTANQIDDYMSNEADGGAMQQRLLTALERVLNSDDTELKFYHENGTERTHYIYFVDDNENGKMDPGEMHLAYDIKDRENAPQVDILRDGHTVLDLNMLCGYQPNFVEAPEGIRHVSSDEDTNRNRGNRGSKSGGGSSNSIEHGSSSETINEETTNKVTNTITTTTTTEEKKPGEPAKTPEKPSPEPDKPKDAENLKRIDKEINEDIAEDIGSEEVNTDQTSSEEVESQERTEKPDSDSYEGTEAETVKNDSADEAEEVQEDTSSDNDYEEDRGGSHEDEYSPVEEDNSAQEEADQSESSNEESSPDTVEESEDELEDLGIE